MNDSDQREEALLQAALKLPPKERAAYLDRACGGDEPLRQRIVERLFKAGQTAGTVPEQPPASPPAATVAIPVVPEPPGEKPGDRIGHYKLIEQLGEGGMGSVWVAEQTEPVRREVALKIIKLGMDTKEVIARFEAERQALALMDDPNIAKVLDAGATDTGRPYFVMERIKGIPITKYCDDKKLDTRQRLELFIQVCQAIQHAHQKGIIHRDIKPSNILVVAPAAQGDGRPVPKVIDFGIAKATGGQVLTDQSIHTMLAEFIGTPAYMAPEQAELEALDIDTRSDIYSLGVLLYELLTGRTPFDAQRLLSAGLEGIRRIIREEEPPRPSTRLSTLDAKEQTTVAHRRQTEPPKLIHLVRGDLDWIVLKTLEKDRARRYETANGLARDIERYLNSEPVVARPPSSVYRLQKLVRRNRVVFAAAGVIATALVAAVAISAWGLIKEQQARRRAEANERKAQQVAQFLNDMLSGVGPSVALGRDTTLLREILDNTAKRIGSGLTNQPEVEGELRYTLGEVYLDLGDLDKAESMHRQALELRRSALGSNHPTTALSMSRLGRVWLAQRKLAEAEDILRQALASQRAAPGDHRADMSFSLNELSAALNARGGSDQRKEAEALLREALSAQKKLFGQDSLEVAATLEHLGEVLRYVEKRDEAEVAEREALTLRRKHPENQLGLASSLGLLASLLSNQGKPDEAESLCREALSIQRRLFGKEHPAVAARLNSLGLILRDRGKLADAERTLTEALEMRQRLLGKEHPDVTRSLNDLASVLEKRGKFGDAEALRRDALAMQRRLLGNEDVQVAISLHYLGCALLAQGKLAEAETVLREALRIWRKLHGEENLQVAGSLYYLGRVLYAQGRLSEAETTFREVVTMRQKLFGKEHAGGGDSLCCLGQILRTQARLTEAAAAFREAAAQGNVEACLRLGRMCRLGEGVGPDAGEATKWLRKAAEGKDAQALNNLAWSLAASHSAEVRDGCGAVSFAEKAVEATSRTNATYLDTLAAAYAEARDFANAISTQKEAIALLGDGQAKKDFATRLKLYESNTPYQEGK